LPRPKIAISSFLYKALKFFLFLPILQTLQLRQWRRNLWHPFEINELHF